MIKRDKEKQLLEALQKMPVVVMIGPRQVGKTTLALEVAKQINKPNTYLDLESDADFNKLTDAEAYLKRFSDKLLIIDEVQRKPELFRILRGIVDERKRSGEKTGHFLLLGSASADLLQNSSESLAGRVRYIELSPFTFNEIHKIEMDTFNYEKLWLRGGFPDSFLALNQKDSWQWRNDFFKTYVERDIPSMGVGASATKLKRFWIMLSHYHGNQINLSEFGRSLETSHTTIKNYLDILTDFYMVRQLEPWSGNVKKRLVKSPKLFIRDSGILHSLLQISNMERLFSHPKIGASWEGFVIENILQELDERWEYSYYRTATQVEIDLVLKTPENETWAIEIKRSTAPKLKRGFHEACTDIGASHKWVISPNDESYPLSGDTEVIGLKRFIESLHSFNS